MEFIQKYVKGFYNLFFQERFMFHRIFGLLYLIQYTLATFLYFYNYKSFLNSPVIITLPLTGIIQSLTAIFTFTFLPKKSNNQGYYSGSLKNKKRQGSFNIPVC
jgi:hypothetical protein